MSSTYKPELVKCTKPDCLRRVPVGTAFCCGPCRTADAGHYEIHESGPLAHSEGCDERHARRQELVVNKWGIFKEK